LIGLKSVSEYVDALRSLACGSVELAAPPAGSPRALQQRSKSLQLLAGGSRRGGEQAPDCFTRMSERRYARGAASGGAGLAGQLLGARLPDEGGSSQCGSARGDAQDSPTGSQAMLRSRSRMLFPTVNSNASPRASYSGAQRLLSSDHEIVTGSQPASPFKQMSSLLSTTDIMQDGHLGKEKEKPRGKSFLPPILARMFA
jgi:hypothetical protein